MSKSVLISFADSSIQDPNLVSVNFTEDGAVIVVTEKAKYTIPNADNILYIAEFESLS